MRYLLTIFVFIRLTFVLFGQNNLLPTNPFFRDKLTFDYSQNGYYVPCLFPALENDYQPKYPMVIEVYIDSAQLKKPFFKRDFNKHLVEIKGKDYNLKVSPVGELNLGNDLKDSSNAFLFQNTRGILVEGDITRNFSFSTSFYESQARFSSFENHFIANNGEFYTTSNGYIQQNGIVPGAARTKPFKGNGYDYAFASGNFVYRPWKQLTIIAGNNQQFIGTGYRSMLLADNNVGTPYMRLDFRLNRNWSFHYLRSRYMNLVRKKKYTTVEGYYQPKGYSANFITYQPFNKLSISFFEGSIWNMGDSLTTRGLNPSFFIPLPGISALFSSQKTYSIYGLNANLNFFKTYFLYGQVAFGRRKNQFAYQIGGKAISCFGIKKLMIQLEFNGAINDMYTSLQSRLDYSNYNLPIAHIKATNFNELLFRTNWAYKKFYIDFKSSNFILTKYNEDALQPIQLLPTLRNGVVLNQKLETGLRINQTLNFSVFSSILWRKEMLDVVQTNFLFQVGFRTGLMSQTNDY